MRTLGAVRLRPACTEPRSRGWSPVGGRVYTPCSRCCGAWRAMRVGDGFSRLPLRHQTAAHLGFFGRRMIRLIHASAICSSSSMNDCQPARTPCCCLGAKCCGVVQAANTAVGGAAKSRSIPMPSVAIPVLAVPCSRGWPSGRPGRRSCRPRTAGSRRSMPRQGGAGIHVKTPAHRPQSPSSGPSRPESHGAADPWGVVRRRQDRSAAGFLGRRRHPAPQILTYEL